MSDISCWWTSEKKISCQDHSSFSVLFSQICFTERVFILVFPLLCSQRPGPFSKKHLYLKYMNNPYYLQKILCLHLFLNKYLGELTMCQTLSQAPWKIVNKRSLVFILHESDSVVQVWLAELLDPVLYTPCFHILSPLLLSLKRNSNPASLSLLN